MVRKMVINNEEYVLDAPDDMPLLWVLRDILELTGTKFGCGKAHCGACTVLINDSPARSCVTPLSAVAHQEITTIEGLANLPESSLQYAWVEHNVPQCGYCQSGQLMSAAALLRQHPNPTDAEIDQGMSGNICRCGTYPRIKKAIKSVSTISSDVSSDSV
jgi:isoquinoline 1-oxidoreductase alpha subunit